jgi:HEAT repeat protein
MVAPRVASALLFALCGCSRDPAPAPGTAAGGAEQDRAGATASSRPATVPAAKNPRGFPDWHNDFPIELELSPHIAGQWYPRTARQALVEVTKHLSGACSQAAWHFAHDFYRRAPDDAIELLQEELEASLYEPERASTLENVLEAMATMGRPQFAPFILKAIRHKSDGVRAKAALGLVRSGTKEALLSLQKDFGTLDPRAQVQWVRAAVAHLGPDVVPAFKELLERKDYAHLQKDILEAVRSLPDQQALAVVKPLYEAAFGDTKVFFATLLHQRGDTSGTALVREALRGDHPALKSSVLEGLVGSNLEWLLPDVLKCAISDDVGLRRKAARVLADAPGENIDKVLEFPLGADRDNEVRRTALWALKKRGQRKLLDELAQEIRTASGTRLREALEDVSSASDGAAVPAIYERYLKAMETSPADGQDLLRVIAFTHSPEAFEPLSKELLGPERAFAPGGRQTTHSYIPVILANLTGEEPRVLALFESLPRSDYGRRALLVYTLANMAGGGSARREVMDLIYGRLRTLLADTTEESQMRLLALQFLRRDFRLEDAMKLKGMLRSEPEPMRKALNDFLFEFF